MPTQNFLDNLENLRLVTSVSLEHLQRHLHEFARSATGAQARQADKAIGCIRALNDQLENEFMILESLMGESIVVTTPQLRVRAQ